MFEGGKFWVIILVFVILITILVVSLVYITMASTEAISAGAGESAVAKLSISSTLGWVIIALTIFIGVWYIFFSEQTVASETILIWSSIISGLGCIIFGAIALSSVGTSSASGTQWQKNATTGGLIGILGLIPAIVIIFTFVWHRSKENLLKKKSN